MSENEGVMLPDKRLTLTEAEAESHIPAAILKWRLERRKANGELVNGEWYILRSELAKQGPPSHSWEKRKGTRVIPKRKYTKRAAGKSKVTQKGTINEEEAIERHIAYAFGRTEQWLEIYAHSLGLPAALITHRVGELLQSQTGGTVLGPRD